MKRGPLPTLLLPAALLLGCSSTPPPALEIQPFELQEVAWNRNSTPVGRVTGVAELADDTLILGDQGALVFTGSVLLSSDPAVRDWRGAAVLPAGDKSGQWLVGVGGDGRLRRLRSRSSMEDISDRYALKDRKILDVADLGQGRVAFGLAPDSSPAAPPGSGEDLAIADGEQVKRYALSLPRLVGGSGRVAAVIAPSDESSGEVRVFDLPNQSVSSYAVRDPVAAAFLPDGRLLVAAARAIYREDVPGGELLRIHVSDEPITDLVVSGAAAWLRIGGALCVLDGSTLRRSEPVTAPGEVALHPSESGDVWLRTGGALRRFSAGGDEQADSSRWEREVQPLFATYCKLCHLPGGSAGIDLSTYRSWASRRALIEQRVLLAKPSPMPPAGAGVLTPQEQETLKGWLKK